MCSVLPPSANAALTEKADWPGLGAFRAAMKVPTAARAFATAAFMRGSSSATYVTLSAGCRLPHPARATATAATMPGQRAIRFPPSNRLRGRGMAGRHRQPSQSYTARPSSPATAKVRPSGATATAFTPPRPKS